MTRKKSPTFFQNPGNLCRAGGVIVVKQWGQETVLLFIRLYRTKGAIS